MFSTVGAAAAAARHRRFDDALIDYKKYGTTIELAGEDKVGGRPAWRLIVTLEDGFRDEVLIDRETYLQIGERKAAPIHAFGASVRSQYTRLRFRAPCTSTSPISRRTAPR